MSLYLGQKLEKLMAQPNFYDRVALGLIPGISTINKFGETEEVDTATTPQDIWSGAPLTYSVNGGKYIYSTTNPIDSISSDSATDANEVCIIGLDFTTWEEVTQTVTLNGQNRVALTTPLIRVYRAFNCNGVLFLGNIYIYENTALSGGIPVDLTKLRMRVNATQQQSQMAIYTVPSGKVALLIQGYLAISKSGASNGAIVGYQIREFGGVFRNLGNIFISTTGSNHWKYKFGVPVMIPEKTDVKFSCFSVTANDTGIIAGFDIILFDKKIWKLS